MRPSRSVSAARAASVCFCAVAEILARALVDDHDGDRGERLAVLAGEGRIGEREHQQRERDRAHQRAAAARPRTAAAPRRQRNGERRPQHVERNQRRECDAEIQNALLLPQPLEQRRHVHLIGLVVAGQRVHHDVDAGAEGQFALARLARRPSAASAGRPGRIAQAPARSFEVIRIEDTPSPARAGRFRLVSSSRCGAAAPRPRAGRS